MLGLILLVFAQLACAIGAILIRKYLSIYSSLLVTGMMSVIASLMFLPVLFLGFKETIGNFTFKSIWPFIISSIFWLVIAEIFYIYGFQKATSLTIASLTGLLFPLFCSILGIIFFKEVLTWKIIFASLLMFSGFIVLII